MSVIRRGAGGVEDGEVTGVAEGSATITVSLEDDSDISASAEVTVEDADEAPAAENIVRNGDFESGLDYWELWSHDEASTVEVEDAEAVVDIASIGDAWWAVQFMQKQEEDNGEPVEGTYIEIPEAGTYTLSLTAKADAARDLMIELNCSPPAVFSAPCHG